MATSKRIAGNSIDIGNANNLITPDYGYNLQNLDTTPDALSSLQKGDIYLGGVNKNVTPQALQGLRDRGVTVLTGSNRGQTSSMLSDYLKNYGQNDQYNYYKSLAADEINPQINEKETAIKNNLNSILAGLSSQTGDINSIYDTYANTQNLNNQKAKNNLANSAIGHGLGRSSILESNLGEADQANNRALSSIETQRANKLNSVSASEQAAKENAANSTLDLENNKQSSTDSLARQLMDKALDREFQQQQAKQTQDNWLKTFSADQDWKSKEFNKEVSDTNWEHNYNNKTFNLQKTNADRDYALNKLNSDRDYNLKNRELNLSAAKMASYGSGGSRSRGSGSSRSNSNSSFTANGKNGNNAAYMAWEEFQRQINNGTAYQWLTQNAAELKNDVGATQYNKMKSDYYTYMQKKSNAEKLASMIRAQ